MKELFVNILKHLQTALAGKNGIVSILLLTGTCYINYFTPFSFWSTQGTFVASTTWFTFLFGFFFISGFVLMANKEVLTSLVAEKKILLLAGMAPLLFALKITLPFAQVLPLLVAFPLAGTLNPASWLGGFVFIIVGILFIHRIKEGSWNLYYAQKRVKPLPYFLLLTGMFPLIAMAAVLQDFSQVYPRANEVSLALNTSATVSDYVLFELFYVMDFLTIELFFRGFLIAAFSKLLGVRVILPAALFYFSIHLGKPMLEAIGSFFGGLILGSVSFQTNSIWGGWLVHVGIALLMELLATLF